MHWLPWWAYPAACCVLFGGGCGWVLGYLHRGVIEWGRRGGRLLAWRQRHRRMPGPWRLLARACRRAWRYLAPGTVWGDVRRCWTTGRWT